MTSDKKDDPYLVTDAGIQEPPASLWTALGKIGPGIILAGSIVGSGELILTTSLGADWGFVFLWLVLFSCVIKVFVQIELGRYAISSGLPTLSALDKLPGPRLGTHWLVWWWLGMLLLSVFQLGAMVGSVGQALHLAMPNVSPAIANLASSISSRLGEAVSSRPEQPWAVLTALAAVLLLLSGGYKRIERITTVLVAGVTLTTVVCVLLLPATGFPLRLSDVAKGLDPTTVFSLPAAAIALAFSTFGITGVGASELYAYPYWCLEKGYARFTGPRSESPEWARRARGWLRVMRLDSWVSMVVFTIATVAFYFLGATVLHRRDLHPKGAKLIETLAEMYVPVFGPRVKAVFLIGVWAVLFKTLYVASAGHARLCTDFLGLAGVVRFTEAQQRHRWIQRFCVFFPTLALVLYLLIREPKTMVAIGGYAQGVTIPVIAWAALYLRHFRTDKRITPTRLSDFFLWIAVFSITAVALYAVFMDIVPSLIKRLSGG
jgi:Mn2+/Fe2+ NRAMP family transporter